MVQYEVVGFDKALSGNKTGSKKWVKIRALVVVEVLLATLYLQIPYLCRLLPICGGKEKLIALILILINDITLIKRHFWCSLVVNFSRLSRSGAIWYDIKLMFMYDPYRFYLFSSTIYYSRKGLGIKTHNVVALVILQGTFINLWGKVGVRAVVIFGIRFTKLYG